jgi:transcription elongation factor GreB
VLTIVDSPPSDRQRVFFGAWVRVENSEGDESVYRIVGPDEFEPSRGFISIDSPVAKALLGRREGDEVVVQRPVGTMEYTVLEISYEELC